MDRKIFVSKDCHQAEDFHVGRKLRQVGPTCIPPSVSTQYRGKRRLEPARKILLAPAFCSISGSVSGHGPQPHVVEFPEDLLRDISASCWWLGRIAKSSQ